MVAVGPSSIRPQMEAGLVRAGGGQSHESAGGQGCICACSDDVSHGRLVEGQAGGA